MNPSALRLDVHAHPVTQLGGGDGFDGGAKVVDIKAPAQTLGQAGFHEFNHQQLALLANVYTDLAVGQRHHDTACAIFTTPEIKVAQRQYIAVLVFGK